MLGIGFLIFVSEYFLLPINEVVVYLLLAPLGEELVKSSVLVVCLVSFVDYQATGERKSKLLCVDSLALFFLLLYVITTGEVFYPGNPLSGVDLLWLSVKKFGGHFALTVIGCMVFGLVYQRSHRNRTVVGLIGVSVSVSALLHSLINQMGLGVFLGALLPVSQELVMGALFLISVVLFILFFKMKGKVRRGRNDQ